MTALKCLTAAAAALAVSFSVAAACDGYMESTAAADAAKAPQVAQSAATEQAPTKQALPYTPIPAQPTSVAAAETKAATDAASGVARQ
jgi:hypothetical protein